MSSFRSYLFRAACMAALMAAFASPLPAQADAAQGMKPRVAVFGFLNFTGDDTFDNPTETATGNLVLSLRIIGRYEVVKSEVFLRDLSDQSLGNYCRKEGFDYVLFGTLKPVEDSQQYTLAVYDLAKGATTIREKATGSSVLDVFGVSDTLIQEVLGSITGTHLVFGSIRFENTGEPGAWDVSIDDVTIPGSPSLVDYVSGGNHAVRIVATVGGKRVELPPQPVVIAEGKTATVSFAIPPSEPLSAPGATAGQTPAPAVPQAPAAETDAPIPAASMETPKKKVSLPPPVFAIAIYGSFFPLSCGDLGNMVDGMFGGGIAADRRISAKTGLRLGLRCEGNVVDAKRDDFDSFSNAGILAGLSLPIVTRSWGTVSPELSCGLWGTHAVLKPEEAVYDESGNLKDLGRDFFLQPVIQASIDIRFLRGTLGWTLSPVVTVFPNPSSGQYLIGARAGIVYGGSRRVKK